MGWFISGSMGLGVASVNGARVLRHARNQHAFDTDRLHDIAWAATQAATRASAVADRLLADDHAMDAAAACHECDDEASPTLHGFAADAHARRGCGLGPQPEADDSIHEAAECARGWMLAEDADI